MVSMSASLNLPLHHKVQKFSSGTGSPGWSRKKCHKMAVVWWWWFHTKQSEEGNHRAEHNTFIMQQCHVALTMPHLDNLSSTG